MRGRGRLMDGWIQRVRLNFAFNSHDFTRVYIARDSSARLTEPRVAGDLVGVQCPRTTGCSK